VAVHEDVSHSARGLPGRNHVEPFVRREVVSVEGAKEERASIAGRERAGENDVEIGAEAQ
jgi:hypothetical protein